MLVLLGGVYAPTHSFAQSGLERTPVGIATARALFSEHFEDGVDSAKCTIRLRGYTGRLFEEPMETIHTVQLKSGPGGLSGDGYEFKLLDSPLRCEVRLQARNSGTLINCWAEDNSWGIKSDRTEIKGPNECTTRNNLAYMTPRKGYAVILECE